MDLVTGGTGFVGSHIVRALLERDRAVRCLVRPQNRRDNLAGLPVEIVEGDLTDAASLARAVAGVDTLYHVAADYRLWAQDPTSSTAPTSTEPTCCSRRRRRLGVRRVVYTSSVAALGLNPDGSPANETHARRARSDHRPLQEVEVRRRAGGARRGQDAACPSWS